MTKMQLGMLGGFVFVGVAIVFVLQQQARSTISVKDELLRQQGEQLAQLVAENERMSNQLAQVNGPGGAGQTKEVLRLRGEVVSLKKQLAELLPARENRSQPAPAAPPPEPAELQKEQVKQLAIAKMNNAKYWVLALRQYAGQHDGQFPASFDEAQAFLPEAGKAQALTAASQFEIVYQGSLSELSNPAQTIVIREKTAWQTPDGRWAKGYGFADGHSEIHAEAEANFDAWEAERMVVTGETEEPAQ
jgi:hypothetical protein